MKPLTFMRNKLVGIEKPEGESLIVHGFLDDDLYSLEMDVGIRISDGVILTAEGRWNRWMTPECPRALLFLREAVGLSIHQDDFPGIVFKIVGRKACRHFANLLAECGSAAREALFLLSGERRAGGALSPPSRSPGEEPGGNTAAVRKESGGPERFREKREGETPGEMVIDLHVHSSPASPCSAASADQMIEEAKAIGLDGICLTDHNFVWDRGRVEELRRKHNFLILRGSEITTDQGDMIVFGFQERIDGIVKLTELRQRVSRAGGFIVVAHPFRGFLTFGVGQLGLTASAAMERPLFRSVDGVEVLNSKATAKENAFAREVASGLRLPATGGSDAHEVAEVGRYATLFLQEIRDEEALVKALRSGNYRPVAFREETASGRQRSRRRP